MAETKLLSDLGFYSGLVLLVLGSVLAVWFPYGSITTLILSSLLLSIVGMFPIRISVVQLRVIIVSLCITGMLCAIQTYSLASQSNTRALEFIQQQIEKDYH